MLLTVYSVCFMYFMGGGSRTKPGQRAIIWGGGGGPRLSPDKGLLSAYLVYWIISINHHCHACALVPTCSW